MVFKKSGQTYWNWCSGDPALIETGEAAWPGMDWDSKLQRELL